MKTGCYTYRKKNIREKRQSLEMKNTTADVKTSIEWLKGKIAEIFPSGAKRQRLKKKKTSEKWKGQKSKKQLMKLFSFSTD